MRRFCLGDDDDDVLSLFIPRGLPAAPPTIWIKACSSGTKAISQNAKTTTCQNTKSVRRLSHHRKRNNDFVMGKNDEKCMYNVRENEHPKELV